MKPPKHECAWCDEGFHPNEKDVAVHLHEKCWAEVGGARALLLEREKAKSATGTTIFVHEMNADIEVGPGDVVHVLAMNATVRVREQGTRAGIQGNYAQSAPPGSPADAGLRGWGGYQGHRPPAISPPAGISSYCKYCGRP